MRTVPIPGTDLEVSRLSLGTNVFGWSIDEAASHTVLDAYVAAGGNFLDCADKYSSWIPGNSGGEAETILGTWLAGRPRDSVIVATKIGAKPDRLGLSADNVKLAVEESLTRLQTDYVDVLYAHEDDADTPIEETLTAFAALIAEGKVRHIAASNFTAERLRESLAVSADLNVPRYVLLQTEYNLMARDQYESELEAVCVSENVGCVPYYGLAKGFLTGKYRPGTADEVQSPRAGFAKTYLDERGERVLAALDQVADARSVPVASVALAWLAERPSVVVPTASARTVEQLEALLPAGDLVLAADEMATLNAASA